MQLAGQGVPVTYASGVEFESLRCERRNLPARDRHTLRIETAVKGDVIVCVNDNHWLATAGQDRTSYSLDVTQYVKPAATNTFDVWCTSAIFPFAQIVRQVELE
jgi:hypothetical protein